LKRRAFCAAASLALGLALIAPAAASAQRTVSVSGEATVVVPNDSAGLGFSVTKTRGRRSAALRAVAGKLRAVIAAVQASPGVGDGDVVTGAITVRKVEQGKRSAYRASEGIHVISHQPDAAGELVSTAIAAGATGTRGPTFFAGSSTAAYNAALQSAFDQARERAIALAARAGAGLGPVISIAEGGEVTPVLSEDTAKASPGCGSAPAPVAAKSSVTECAGSPPVKPGRTSVSATVHVVFELL
jgi:uncharacterized protein YggE